MSTALLNTGIDSTQPVMNPMAHLAAASQIVKASNAILSLAPLVRRQMSRMARNFVRSRPAGMAQASFHGASRYYRRNIQPEFSRMARLPATLGRRMASSLLMDGSRQSKHIPRAVTWTDILMARVNLMKAKSRMGLIFRRVSSRFLDMRDGRADTAPLVVAKGRFTAPAFAMAI